MSEVINHPDHYNTESFECIDVMEEVFGAEAVKNFCKLNAFKYLWRADEKDGMDDIRKARWYLERIQSLEAEEDEPDDDQESDDDSHLYDTVHNLFDAVKNAFKKGMEMYAESIDPESEASKRLRYFQLSKKKGFDEDVCFITALRNDMDQIEKSLELFEEDEDEQSSEKSGEE